MTNANVFKRYELKFFLNSKQKQELLKTLEGHMKLDKFGRSTIKNIYYDTPDNILIRTSLDKPVYKEKLRVRAYGNVGSSDNVFVELKKKYKGIVYKRRVVLPESIASSWLAGEITEPYRSQISDEIEYARCFYEGIRPDCFLSYTREAYEPIDGSDIRLTLDEDILARDYDLSLTKGTYGDRVLPEGITLMEIKVPGAIPMWMTEFLTKNGIYKASFSKYGAYYKQKMQKTTTIYSFIGGIKYA
ncbi:MAG: polyphosphate polymerase domain-containing protein [Saccharofermentans sp.]|nr:polyphosphate polymerase domain-containing protein [Saccharofermentans sp.]